MASVVPAPDAEPAKPLIETGTSHDQDIQDTHIRDPRGIAAGCRSGFSRRHCRCAGPFDKETVDIAVVSFLGGGDWLQAFEAGVKRQADALGVNLTISQARNDNDTQRSLVEQAINLGVDGIIINNGRPEVLQDVAQKALDAGSRSSPMT